METHIFLPKRITHCGCLRNSFAPRNEPWLKPSRLVFYQDSHHFFGLLTFGVARHSRISISTQPLDRELLLSPDVWITLRLRPRCPAHRVSLDQRVAPRLARRLNIFFFFIFFSGADLCVKMLEPPEKKERKKNCSW